MNYLKVPDSNIKLTDGSVVMLARFPGTKWVVHYGWYDYSGRRGMGWYFSSIPAQTVIPVTAQDLDLIVLIDQGKSEEPERPPIPDHPPAPGPGPDKELGHKLRRKMDDAGRHTRNPERRNDRAVSEEKQQHELRRRMGRRSGDGPPDVVRKARYIQRLGALCGLLVIARGEQLLLERVLHLRRHAARSQCIQWGSRILRGDPDQEDHDDHDKLDPVVADPGAQKLRFVLGGTHETD